MKIDKKNRLDINFKEAVISRLPDHFSEEEKNKVAQACSDIADTYLSYNEKTISALGVLEKHYSVNLVEPTLGKIIAALSEQLAVILQKNSGTIH